jgi:hypothetical protein
MSLYDSTVPQFIKILGQVQRWLDKAEAYATQKKFDPQVLLTARLAPDQFHFIRQVQIMSDTAKRLAARLTGQDPPKFEDNEATIAELRARVEKTVDYLKTFKPEQFEGAKDRSIPIFFLPGKSLKGSEYAIELEIPNFYFHATTAYAILRHNGLDVGKTDFLGDIQFRDM